MATREQIITELYATHFVDNYVRCFAGKADRVYLDDITAELYLIISELPATLLTGIYASHGINGIRRYVSGVITRQLRSDNSRVYRKYTRHVYRHQPCEQMLWAEKHIKD